MNWLTSIFDYLIDFNVKKSIFRYLIELNEQKSKTIRESIQNKILKMK